MKISIKPPLTYVPDKDGVVEAARVEPVLGAVPLQGPYAAHLTFQGRDELDPGHLQLANCDGPAVIT